MDDDEKVRRNLVVVSVVILVFAWLDIPFSAFIGKFVDQKYSNPDVYKLWALGFSIMIYTGVRYRFSKEGDLYESEIQGDILRKKEVGTYLLAQAQADRFTKTGREPAVFDGKLCEFTQARLLEMDRGSVLGDWGRPTMILSIYNATNGDPWNFSMSVNSEWRLKGEKISIDGGQSIDVKIKGRHRWSIEAKARFHTWGYSASSINYLVPVLLALCAVSTIFIKVLQAYLAAG